MFTPDLYDEQALEGHRCLKSELTPKGKRGQKMLPKELSVAYSVRSRMAKEGGGRTGLSLERQLISPICHRYILER